MRLITLSALFLFVSTTLAAPLDLSSRQEDTYSSLALRDGAADTVAAIGITARSDFDDENWLERRVIKAKKIANKAARKERKTAAKAQVAQAKQKGMNKSNASQGKKAAKTPAGVKASHSAGKTAAQNKKQELKSAAQAKHLQMKAAGAEHRKTTELPGRNQKFTVAAGNGKFPFHCPDFHGTSINNAGKPERTYTGKDVRKANFGSHIKNNAGSVCPPSHSRGRGLYHLICYSDSGSHLPTTSTSTQGTRELRSPSLVWSVQATSTHCPERPTIAK